MFGLGKKNHEGATYKWSDGTVRSTPPPKSGSRLSQGNSDSYDHYVPECRGLCIAHRGHEATSRVLAGSERWRTQHEYEKQEYQEMPGIPVEIPQAVPVEQVKGNWFSKLTGGK